MLEFFIKRGFYPGYATIVLCKGRVLCIIQKIVLVWCFPETVSFRFLTLFLLFLQDLMQTLDRLLINNGLLYDSRLVFQKADWLSIDILFLLHLLFDFPLNRVEILSIIAGLCCLDMCSIYSLDFRQEYCLRFNQLVLCVLIFFLNIQFSPEIVSWLHLNKSFFFRKETAWTIVTFH